MEDPKSNKTALTQEEATDKITEEQKEQKASWKDYFAFLWKKPPQQGEK